MEFDLESLSCLTVYSESYELLRSERSKGWVLKFQVGQGEKGKKLSFFIPDSVADKIALSIIDKKKMGVLQ